MCYAGRLGRGWAARGVAPPTAWERGPRTRSIHDDYGPWRIIVVIVPRPVVGVIVVVVVVIKVRGGALCNFEVSFEFLTFLLQSCKVPES